MFTCMLESVTYLLYTFLTTSFRIPTDPCTPIGQARFWFTFYGALSSQGRFTAPQNHHFKVCKWCQWNRRNYWIRCIRISNNRCKTRLVLIPCQRTFRPYHHEIQALVEVGQSWLSSFFLTLINSDKYAIVSCLRFIKRVVSVVIFL